MSELTHLDSEGRARMVDVSAKVDSARTAVAAGEFVTTPEVIALVRADDLPKADVLATARIAGIGGAKRTSELIPLCHQLALSSVKIAFGFTDTSITIEATAKTRGPTGVEMEALTAVAVAGLTLHDMVKAVDPAALLTNVRLLTKQGGKSGHWTRLATPQPATNGAAVLVASTGVANGTREDKTGPVITEWLAAKGMPVRGPLVYADADIAAGIADALTGAPALIISTGGTGASPTDATPEATLAVLDRELPGVAEAIRAKGAAKFPHASLSRGVAGLAGRTVLINLPGSPGGVRDGLAVLDDLLDHLLAQVAGGGAHE
ncbi:MAG TPA: bifunctional molybdenum cofactor biosynthesis protein MoaC/MoaB [Aldersonia sp.]